ncbi:hypothetical protein JHN63_47745 [Streptomyces sp. MBT65]|uniref:hypothetical protein n=1 Tax=Streptomyces sp. MBT65 TaxID=1488395 RepID=UPI00190BD8C8|nr:hypothetical protein [Streptomyces sp. MBT65]MBK3581335.1 hypothetical protein [Streptomyces sp. MBT65]
MIWPAAAIPGAAPRVTRTAVGRRVLQLALLVGGLFAVGLLCGGQAQAADRVLGTPVSLGRPGIPAAASVVKPAPARVSAPVPVLAPVLAPVLGPVSDTVERVVQPVSDVVTKTVTAVLAEAPSLPTLPTAPTLPSLPVVPTQPVLPVQAPPAHAAPVSTPVRSDPQPSSGGHRSDAAPAEAAVGVGATYGPRFVAATDEVGAVGHAALRRAPSVGRAPAHQAPNGDPDGAPRDQQAMDSGSSRHCDAQAVTLDQRVAVRFVCGVAEGTDAAETRDRYRDVPVFPG